MDDAATDVVGDDATAAADAAAPMPKPPVMMPHDPAMVGAPVSAPDEQAVDEPTHAVVESRGEPVAASRDDGAESYVLGFPNMAEVLDHIHVASARHGIEYQPQPIPPQPIALTWNSAIHDAGCEGCADVQQIAKSRPYRLQVRLGEGGGRGKTSGTLEGIVRELDFDDTLALKLLPLFVEGVAPPVGMLAQPVDFVVRQPASPGMPWASATLDIRALPDAKRCAQLILSVWDSDIRVAYDAFVVTIPVLGRWGASRCRDPLAPNTVLAEPTLVSVTDVFDPQLAKTSTTDGDRISLYAFELPTHTRDSYAFTVIDPIEGVTKVSGWKLKSPLSKSFGDEASSFSKAAQSDRTNMKSPKEGAWIYERTAKFIKSSLFNGKDTVSGADADDVFRDIQEFVNGRSTTVKMMAQLYVPISGEEYGLMFLPLRTLAAQGSQYFKNDFQLVSPLPSAGEEEESCISDWKLILNPKLAPENDDDERPTESAERVKRLTALLTKPWRGPTLTDFEDIEDYLAPEGDAGMPDDVGDGATGVIIAAHYGGNSLGLDGADLPVNQLSRTFPRNSAAILAACETAAPTEASGLINQLRQSNVDAFLASPLKVPTDYALALVESLVTQVDQAYLDHLTPTLGELYEQAMEQVAKKPNDSVEMQNLAREYVLVGNPDRRLCKLPSTTEQDDETDDPTP